jgi:hypothetical protein
MKKLVILLFCLLLVACTLVLPDLENGAIGFNTSSYIDESDGTGYLTFEYNGRVYLPYGIQNGKLKTKDIDKCIGYIIQDENSSSVVDLDNKDTRIYTLTIDKENNFLMEYYIGTTLMNPKMFYRAMDTKGKDINIPNYIDTQDYNYWN